MPHVPADRPLRADALPPLRPQRTASARDLPRSVVELRARPSARDEPRDRPARIRPRGHPLRPREQLRAAVRLGGGELRRARRAGPAPLPGRARHLDEGRLRHVARTVWRPRLAQVPPREPRPEPRADEARLRRHLLLASLRPGDAARGDDGRARLGRSSRQGAVRRDLVVLGGEDARGGCDPPRSRNATPHPPAVVLDAQPLDRARAARRDRGARGRLYRLLAPRARNADEQVSGAGSQKARAPAGRARSRPISSRTRRWRRSVR